MTFTPDIIVDKPAALARKAARHVALDAAAAIRARARFALALPGGSVAEAFLPALAQAPVDWSRVHVFWVDERAGPAAGPDSNYHLAVSLGFLDPIGPANRHRVPADENDLERAARRYDDELIQFLGTPPVFDVALLGVGADGHIASLFPGHPLLQDETRFAAAVPDSPKPPAGRITVTLPTLAGARSLVVAAFGASKGEAIAQALGDPRSRLPLALALRRSARTLVMLDPACAQAARVEASSPGGQS